MEESGEPCEIDPNDGHTCCEYPCPVCAIVEQFRALCNRQRDALIAHQDEWFLLGFGSFNVRYVGDGIF